MKAGKRAYRSARTVSLPALVVQGAGDELVRPQNTQVLVRRLAFGGGQSAGRLPGGSGGGLRYLEIPGGHNIIDRDGQSWDRLEQALLDFGRSVRDGERKRA
jgi:hypothetical protein